jgi:rSAM/selenodomain-associated transferase 1
MITNGRAAIPTRVPVCIFAKPPVAGQVKTRLAAPARAAELARAFLADTCDAVRALPWADPIVASTGALDIDVPVWPQGDGDLGARIERVLRRALETAPGAIAIGADTPGLPRQLLARARSALENADAAIGPTDDGGFYLLALRCCPEGLLRDLPWSRSHTFAATIERIRDRGLAPVVLDRWFDVDRPHDLERLRALLAAGVIVAPRTYAALAAPPVSLVMPTVS